MEQNNQPAAGQQMQVKVSDEMLAGVYANMAQVAHTPEEFVIDFMNLFPPTGVVTARVIVSPQHIKRLAAALQENIKRYEEQFGQITGGSEMNPHIGFRTE